MANFVSRNPAASALILLALVVVWREGPSNGPVGRVVQKLRSLPAAFQRAQIVETLGISIDENGINTSFNQKTAFPLPLPYNKTETDLSFFGGLANSGQSLEEIVGSYCKWAFTNDLLVIPREFSGEEQRAKYDITNHVRNQVGDKQLEKFDFMVQFYRKYREANSRMEGDLAEAMFLEPYFATKDQIVAALQKSSDKPNDNNNDTEDRLGRQFGAVILRSDTTGEPAIYRLFIHEFLHYKLISDIDGILSDRQNRDIQQLLGSELEGFLGKSALSDYSIKVRWQEPTQDSAGHFLISSQADTDSGSGERRKNPNKNRNYRVSALSAIRILATEASFEMWPRNGSKEDLQKWLSTSDPERMLKVGLILLLDLYGSSFNELEVLRMQMAPFFGFGSNAQGIILNQMGDILGTTSKQNKKLAPNRDVNSNTNVPDVPWQLSWAQDILFALRNRKNEQKPNGFKQYEGYVSRATSQLVRYMSYYHKSNREHKDKNQDQGDN